MTRDEHMKWCKRRAHDELKSGDAGSAIASMASDIQKHDETKMPQETLSMLVLAAAMDGDPVSVARWIDGFN